MYSFIFSQIEGFETKTKELDENLGKLDQIWTISKEWEDFESEEYRKAFIDTIWKREEELDEDEF